MVDQVLEMAPVVGRVKWFDAAKGYGFLVAEEIQGDVLLHSKVLRQFGVKSVADGQTVECIPAPAERGYRATRVISIGAVPPLKVTGSELVGLLRRCRGNLDHAVNCPGRYDKPCACRVADLGRDIDQMIETLRGRADG